MYKISDLVELDYPPRIEIAIQNVPESGALCLHVKGLNTKSIFELLPGMSCLAYTPYVGMTRKCPYTSKLY